MESSSSPSRRIGGQTDYWLYHPSTGYDLTRSLTPRLTLPTATSLPITICPASTALLIIDMQNFFLNPAAGRPLNPLAMEAERRIAEVGIPACQRAGIRVVHLTWGVEERELQEERIPLSVLRGFGSSLEGDDLEDVDGGWGAVKESFGEKPTVGESIGDVKLGDGEVVDGGKLLMRGQWNTALHAPLQALYEASQASPSPHVRFHKSRISGFSDPDSEVARWLRQEGIRTLLFTGVNTDQCVAGSLMDAAAMGFDCVLMRDGCATGSPGYARKGVEFNGRKNWGFVCELGSLEDGIAGMRGVQGS